MIPPMSKKTLAHDAIRHVTCVFDLWRSQFQNRKWQSRQRKGRIQNVPLSTFSKSFLRRENRTFELEQCGQTPLLNNPRIFCTCLIVTVAKRVCISRRQIFLLVWRLFRCPISKRSFRAAQKRLNYFAAASGPQLFAQCCTNFPIRPRASFRIAVPTASSLCCRSLVQSATLHQIYWVARFSSIWLNKLKSNLPKPNVT